MIKASSIKVKSKSDEHCALRAAAPFTSIPYNITCKPLSIHHSLPLSCSLVHFTTSSFVSTEAAFFPPTKSPDHLVLVKGASGSFKTKTKVSYATLFFFEATSNCMQCPLLTKKKQQKNNLPAEMKKKGFITDDTHKTMFLSETH